MFKLYLYSKLIIAEICILWKPQKRQFLLFLWLFHLCTQTNADLECNRILKPMQMMAPAPAKGKQILHAARQRLKFNNRIWKWNWHTVALIHFNTTSCPEGLQTKVLPGKQRNGINVPVDSRPWRDLNALQAFTRHFHF